MKEDLLTTITIPEGVTITRDKRSTVVKGPKGENKRMLFDQKISMHNKNNTLELSAKKATKREKKKMATFTAHIKNMIKGVQEPFVYKLKICSGHFPMNVSLNKNKFSVKNFLGEKVPRILIIKEDVMVKIDGTVIVVTSADKEKAGQAAADIEKLTRITNRDRRIFQDGIYITEKCGKVME